MNGVVASLGVSAIMALATGMQVRQTFQTYRGDRGVVTKKTMTAPEDCYYCAVVRGQAAQADLERYFRKAAAQSQECRYKNNSLIVFDANVVSELMRPTPAPAVMA